MTDVISTDSEVCPIGLSLDVLGQKWTLLIIREALKGLQTFSGFEGSLGCPRNLLASRLRMLCNQGLMTTVRYELPGQRGRDRYELTDAGRELAPTLIALFDWGTRHRPAGNLPWAHPSRCHCGAQLHAVLKCEDGHLLGTVNEVDFPAHPLPAAG